mmetsp:Transcript_52385/g.126784  ORF Transcript_52385/g.126784 Transcript_52385/m.126784 type:complete len:140 (-) Transcript_52385:1171-1590(-)
MNYTVTSGDVRDCKKVVDNAWTKLVAYVDGAWKSFEHCYGTRVEGVITVEERDKRLSLLKEKLKSEASTRVSEFISILEGDSREVLLTLKIIASWNADYGPDQIFDIDPFEKTVCLRGKASRQFFEGIEDVSFDNPPQN